LEFFSKIEVIPTLEENLIHILPPGTDCPNGFKFLIPDDGLPVQWRYNGFLERWLMVFKGNV